MRDFFVVGHRGMGPTSTLSDKEFSSDTLPENSIAAIKHALALGADGVEFDVHLTKDGKVAVIHDDKLNEKVYKANRTGTDLGLVSKHTMEELGQYDIGHGHKIPSFVEVLDLIVSENAKRQAQGKPNLIINIELKGKDVVDATYLTLSDYINDGRLNVGDFIFNSFEWHRLEHIKHYDPAFKVAPAIRTAKLFGKENVKMPDYKVPKGCPYQADALESLQRFHDKVGCYAFDCIVFDLRPEFVDFCKANRIGLLTSTSSEAVKTDKIKPSLALMLEASKTLPFVCFRADNTTDTFNVINALQRNKASKAPVQRKTRPTSKLSHSHF